MKETGLSLENGAAQSDAAFINLLITIVVNNKAEKLLSELR